MVSSRLRERLKRVVSRRSFWILAAMLVGLAFLHYLTPQIRFLPLLRTPLLRHAIERVIFILPVAGATFAFGQAGGLVTLVIAVLIMLPRVFLISPYPMDALTETAAVAVVGYLVIWMIETQEREKRLRQEAVSRLRTINAVTAIVTGSLELEQILNSALDKVLEVAKVRAGSIYLLDMGTQELILAAYRGLSLGFAREAARFELGESLTGWVGQSGEPIVVDDLLQEPRLMTSLASKEGMRSFMAVPLKSRDKVLGVMNLADSQNHLFTSQDLQLLTSIGNQIGVAVENARLYQNMRFYIRHITRAQEEERKRIARELHDDTAQILVAFSRRLDALTSFPEPLPESVRQRLEEFRELAASALQSVRRFSKDLRPPALDDLGLLPALEGLKADIEKEGIQVELKVFGPRQRLSSEVELALFRIVQEALNNVRRHSKASRVLVGVEFCESSVRVMVEDDGRGFQVPDRVVDLVATGKLGLTGMHERARLLGGTLLIQSEPGRGAKVIVDLPVQPELKDKGSTT